MSYSGERLVYDADSHLMELNDWLAPYADPDIRERIRPLNLGGAGKLAREAVTQAEARQGDEAAAAKLESELLRIKGWHALGAFDPHERSRALDLLGFSSQLVFTTFAATQFLGGDDPDLLYGGTRAHNRAIGDFCSDDPRLVAVGFAPWGDPVRTAEAVRDAIDLGCRAVLLPSAPAGKLSPTHPDYDDVWATLQDADVPFMLHVGGGGRSLRPAFHNNARPVTDFLGGGENIRSKDYMTISYAPETFLSCLVLDGIFEKFPRLRGGCIEQGAMWVIPWLRRLDIAQATFKRTEPTLQDLPLTASDYVHRQLWFTPFPTEPVGWMIEDAGDDLFMFSSDYPHPEGTRDPMGRFESNLEGIDDEARDRFYARNYAEMMGAALESAA